MVVLSMISEPGHCSSSRLPDPTDVLYVLRGEEDFTSIEIHNLDINEAHKLP